MANSLQLIMKISATYRLVSYLMADLWLICRLRAQYMISKSNVKLNCVACEAVSPKFLQNNDFV